MPKRCPPGVFCIENITITFILLTIAGIIIIYLYMNNSKEKERINIGSGQGQQQQQQQNMFGLFPQPSYSFSNMPNDILMNPYQAPLRDDRVIRNNIDIRGSGLGPGPVPVATSTVNTSYRQIGILTRVGTPEMILPLMGRPLHTSRDKWNFYTMSDKNNMIKLPITHKNKSCTSEYGCDNLYSGDTVYVEGYNDVFKVTAYENNVLQYSPGL